MMPKEPRQGPKKVNRAKARLQRRAEEMEAQREEARTEAATMTDHKSIESVAMKAKVAALGLQERPVDANGHCLYSAFADQLALLDRPTLTYADMRHHAADYIRTNADDFLPYLLADDGDTAHDVESYTKEIEETPKWGGELEIIALARRYKVAVDVVQAEGETLKYEEGNGDKVRLARYEHMYSLGAHFNSLVPATSKKGYQQ